jgi:Leucine-rich repeat (LRR) protein
MDRKADKTIKFIPPWEQLHNLVQLTILSFAENEFTGLIPPSLGNPKPMLILNLRYTNFQVIIPIEFGNLRKLTKLDLSSNKFSREIPEMGQFQQIDTTRMDQNVLTGNILITFSNLKS